MNVFCVFQRYGGSESLAAICEDLAVAEAWIEQRKRQALEEDEPASVWRVAEWRVVSEEEVPSP